MDRCRLCRTLIIWLTATSLGWCQSNDSDQLQVPVGAYRVFPKTSFSCLGRPAGYYADIQTGCQVYHMCDGLGRQFSYSCPNTTLFQQRMLICDHWYMVNCSRAESDYAANLLIGQRDKPFVPEEENQLRTPRPDLLDRPYAPDYSGESFRNQYKQLPSIQNEIIDYRAEKYNKPGSTRWHINQPSPIILPPGPAPVINRRMDDVDESNVDLGTSFSSNYNSTGDILASVEDRLPEKLPESNVIIPSIKPPSKLYEPPFLYPIWNENYTAEEETTTTVPSTTTTIPLFSRSSATIGGRPLNQAFQGTPPTFPTTTTFSPPTQQSTFSTVKTQEDTSPPRGTNRNDYDFSKYATRQTTEKEERTDSTTGTTSTTESTFTSPSTQSPIEADFGIPRKDLLLPPAPFTAKSEDSEISKPSLLILPPFSEYAAHDIATTQGPPIYYEWKVPSNALEPPKLDPPIGVDGRKEDDYPPETNDSLSTATSFVDSTAENQPRPFSHNPFLAPIVNKSQRSVTAKTATPRSVLAQQPPQTTQPNSLFDTKEKTSSPHSADVDIDKLKKDWSVPDFLFPLENDARTGYEHADIFNSFRVKIPERRSDNNKRWYGENAKCPECHPSFVKPGTCEPCVKRR